MQEEENHHYDSARVEMRHVTKKPLITLERLRRICGERGEEVNHKLDSLQLPRKDLVYISRLMSGHHSYLICWLHKIGSALDDVCRK